MSKYIIDLIKYLLLSSGKILLAAGASVDARNLDGLTALMLAARFGHLQTIEVGLLVVVYLRSYPNPVLALFCFLIIKALCRWI